MSSPLIDETSGNRGHARHGHDQANEEKKSSYPAEALLRNAAAGAMIPFINYDSPRELRAFLAERGLGMRKKFGQNFLINSAARNKLLDALELAPGNNVWEIGPGLGSMTSGLLERGGRVTAFEIDPAFVRILGEFFGSNPDFRLVEGDVLKTWLPEHRKNPNTEAGGDALFLLGNLPYNIGAALLADFIEKGRFFNRIVVTVQREVALRMAAPPGSPDYSSFSVLCASAYNVKLLQVIKGSCFYPVPRVDSQGVRLEPLSRREKLPKLFYPLVRSLFSARRKTVRNTLSAFAASVIMERGAPAGAPKRETGDAVSPAQSPVLYAPGEAAAEVLKRAGVNGERRPETLGVDEFAALAAFLEEMIFHGR